MTGAGELGELLLKLRDLGPEDELAVHEDGVHAAADIALEPRPLALEIKQADATFVGDREGRAG